MADTTLQFRETDGVTAINMLDFGGVGPGETSAEKTLRIYNTGSETATGCRLFARCANGLYSGQDDILGQEVVTEQWIEGKVGAGAYQAFGGDFGNQGVASNYLALGNITAGNYVEVTVKIVVPSGADTAGTWIVEFGIAHT